MLDTAGFSGAAVAYLFPFFAAVSPGWFQREIGLNVFLFTFPVLGMAPWPTGVVYLASFGLPLIAAVVGVLYRRRARSRESLTPLIWAGAGFSGLAAASFRYLPLPAFDFGYYIAAVGLVLAVAALVVELIIAIRRRHEVVSAPNPYELESAWSPTQILLPRSRGDRA